MKQKQLQKSLGVLINQFGYANVQKALEGTRLKESGGAKCDAKTRCVIADKTSAKSTKKRTKPNAVKIVNSLDIADPGKKEILFIMAKKYEAKEFMPNVNHVRDFLGSERDPSRIKSRQQVTSAVFKQLRDLETSKLREMMDRGLYGPRKKLEDYARAIEGFGRPNRPA